jgi:hypothetical protein
MMRRVRELRQGLAAPTAAATEDGEAAPPPVGMAAAGAAARAYQQQQRPPDQEVRQFSLQLEPSALVPQLRCDGYIQLFVSAGSVRGLHAAVAERLGMDGENFHLFLCTDEQQSQDAGTGERVLISRLSQLGDKATLSLEMSDSAVAERSVAEANRSLHAQIRTSMGQWMQQHGDAAAAGKAMMAAWARESEWMRDTGGARDGEGVPLRAARSAVIQELWAEEAAWQGELARDAAVCVCVCVALMMSDVMCARSLCGRGVAAAAPADARGGARGGARGVVAGRAPCAGLRGAACGRAARPHGWGPLGGRPAAGLLGAGGGGG